MKREDINIEIEKALEHLPPEMRAKLNKYKKDLDKITYKDGITEQEFLLKTKRLEEDFKLDLENGLKSSK